MKILVLHQKGDPKLTIQTNELETLVQKFQDIEWILTETADKYFDNIPQADIIWSNIFPFGYPQNTTQLKWFETTTTNMLEQIPQAAFQNKLLMTNSRSVLAQNASEMIMSYLLCCTKQVTTLLAAQQQKEWLAPSQFPEKHQIKSLADKTLGIIGYGAIGQATAQKAKCFGMQVIASDLRSNLDKTHVDKIYCNEMEPVFAESDYLLISLASTPKTKGIITDKLLSKMKESACLILISPMAVIDENYLFNMLKYQDIAGAVLDSFNMHPLPSIHPLYDLNNVMITPHIACYSENLTTLLIKHFAENLERYLNQKDLLDPIIDYDHL